MYAEYEKAIDNLTINEENKLRKEIEVLTIEKSRLELLEARLDAVERSSKLKTKTV